MQYKGTVYKIMQPQRLSKKFVKREFVISDGKENYPQTILFEVHNSNCELLDGVKVGEDVTIEFKIRGRGWENPQGQTKYFTTLVANEILLNKHYSAPAHEESASAPPDNDLPF